MLAVPVSAFRAAERFLDRKSKKPSPARRSRPRETLTPTPALTPVGTPPSVLSVGVGVDATLLLVDGGVDEDVLEISLSDTELEPGFEFDVCVLSESDAEVGVA